MTLSSYKRKSFLLTNSSISNSESTNSLTNIYYNVFFNWQPEKNLLGTKKKFEKFVKSSDEFDFLIHTTWISQFWNSSSALHFWKLLNLFGQCGMNTLSCFLSKLVLYKLELSKFELLEKSVSIIFHFLCLLLTSLQLWYVSFEILLNQQVLHFIKSFSLHERKLCDN